ncbi:MAG: type II secretion system minor pseudopilin GspH [Pseudomonadota bacterium]
MKRHAARGFTLIEILVVMVLIGITLGLVSVNLMPDDQRTLRDEAQRLALLLDQAQEEAVLRGRALGWQVQDGGYRFVERTVQSPEPGANLRSDNASEQPAWMPVTGNEVLRPRRWPEGLEVLRLSVNGNPASLDEPLVFNPVGLSEPFQMDLALGTASVRLAGDGRRVRVVQDGP